MTPTSVSPTEVAEQIADEPRGSLTPQDEFQERDLQVWRRLNDDWLTEDAFTDRLHKLLGHEEWQGADTSAAFLRLHAFDIIQVRREGRTRLVRRSPEPPRFLTVEEMLQADEDARREQAESDRQAREDAAAERVRELNRGEVLAEKEGFDELWGRASGHATACSRPGLSQVARCAT